MYKPVTLYFPHSTVSRIGYNASVVAYTFNGGTNTNIWFVPGTWVDED